MHDLLMAEAILGRDADDFSRSELGRYILGRCDQEIAEAQAELCTVAWWRRRRIVFLQNKAYRAKSLKGWVLELISNGRQAEAALDEIERE